MARRRALAVAAAQLSSLFGFSAMAQPQTAPLFEWAAPAQCPSSQRVQAQIERHLGRQLSSVSSQLERIDAQVTPNAGSGFKLVIRTHSSAGERTRVLSHHDCTSLANAASVIVAIALDPSAVEHLAPEELTEELEEMTGPEAAVDSATPEIPTPSEDAQSSAAESSERDADTRRKGNEGARSSDRAKRDSRQTKTTIRDRRRAGDRRRGSAAAYHVGVAGGGQVGPLPEAGLGAELNLGVRWQRWWVEGYAQHWTTQSQPFEDLPDAGLDVNLTTGGLRAGPRWASGALALRVGASWELGQMNALPNGLEAERTSRTLWSSVGVESALDVRLVSGLSAVLRIGTVVPLLRQRYVVERSEEVQVHLPSTLGGRILAGLDWAFGANAR